MGSHHQPVLLHVPHYHEINVKARQDELKNQPAASLEDLLTPPLATDTNWTADEITNEDSITAKVSWVMGHFAGLI